MTDAAAELARELRADVPAAVAALPHEDLRHLTAALADQRAAQLGAADEAIDEGLRFLPRVLRAVVRKALMG